MQDQSRDADKRLTFIDLFSGCGGLSLGLQNSGFRLKLAVEKSDMAAETYYHNLIRRIDHPDHWRQYCNLPQTHQLESRLIVGELDRVLNDESLMERITRGEEVDVVVGGPPCQGFSMAGRRDPTDVRNRLVWAFLAFVEAVSPRAVLIENVIGLRQDFKKRRRASPFLDMQAALAQTGIGYVVQPVLLNAMHYGVPQNRPRLMLLAMRSDIAKSLEMCGNTELWRSDYDVTGTGLFTVRPDMAPAVREFGSNPRTAADALWDISDSGYSCEASDPRYQEKECEYARDMRGVGRPVQNAELRNHILRKHGERATNRFQLYHYIWRNSIKSDILNAPARGGWKEEGMQTRLKEMLEHARLPATALDGAILASTTDDLIELIVRLKTKKHSQRPIRWTMPSPTVLSLPDDLVHPLRPRTLTVREMARLQSFPDAFEFRAAETTGGLKRRTDVPQYTQVGNAVPPLLAQAVGGVFSSLLRGPEWEQQEMPDHAHHQMVDHVPQEVQCRHATDRR